ncbi:MAG: four helix bundle protein [Candidatus Omnitrophica bacterium]|nr:four helix bundle protein [Candidatus Omnitrophota bacterium]
MTSAAITTFKDLRVWQEGIQLVKEIYALCVKLPKEELYGLASQMKRAAVSVPSNVAEGHARKHRAEYRQYVYIAIGSLAELETHVLIAKELNLSNGDELTPVLTRIDRLRGMLLTLGRRLG